MKNPVIKSILSIWIFFAPLFAFSQTVQDFKILLKSEILQKDDKIGEFIKKTEKQNTDILPRIYDLYSNYLYDNNRFQKALNTQIKAVDLLKLDSSKKNDSLSQRVLYALGFYHLKLNQNDKGVEAFEKAVKTIPNNSIAARAYGQIGRIYRDRHDYVKAINYYEIANTILKNTNDNRALRTNLISLSFLYRNFKAKYYHDLAVNSLLKADSISQILPKNSSIDYFINYSLGQLFNQNEYLDVEKGEQYFGKALRFAHTLKDSSKIKYINLLKGNLYNTTQPLKAISIHKENLKIANSTDTSYVYALYSNLGYCYASIKEYETSIDYQTKALKEFNNEDFDKIKRLDSTLELKSDYLDNLVVAFPQLADTYLAYFLNSNQTELLDKAIHYYDLADQALDRISETSEELKSQLFWRKQSNAVYGNAIKACFLAKNPEKGFYFMERNKSILLSEEIKKLQFQRSLTIPQELKEEETRLQKAIVDIEIKNDGGGQDFNNVELLQNKRALKNLQDSISAIVPDYSKSYKTSIVTINSLQNDLKKDEAWITYHISSENTSGLVNNVNGYGIYITSDIAHFFEIQKIDSLYNQISLFSKAISKPFAFKKDLKNYIQIGNDLYKTLIPQNIESKIKTITIVPDNELNGIPFEAFITSKEDRNSFLIKEYNISYTYSASFEKTFLENKQTTATGSFLGMASKEFLNSDLSTLNYSIDEVKNIAKNFDHQKIYLDENSTKSNFLESLPNYNIIHLATHASAGNDSEPRIIFSDSTLYLNELYLTHNNANLVVLSGCETNTGEQEIGEGVLSLARGFFLSGSKSVLSSLWKVDDKATPKLMSSFYQHLLNGQTKSKALRQAKLDYLKTHQLSEASPYYWASFILVGDAQALSHKGFELWQILSLIFSLLFLVFSIIIFNKKLTRKVSFQG